MSVPVVGDTVSSPPADVLDRAKVGGFLRWLQAHRGLSMTTHQQLHSWSVEDLEGFWSAVWEHFSVISHTPHDRVLDRRAMPGARWFEGSTLNYAEHALRWSDDPEKVVVLGRSQTRPDVDLTAAELSERVARAASVLAGLGVREGDRVVAYLPNVPETLVAFLATASLGAVWASCALELGPRSVTDRFAQVEPVVLLVAGGYRYGGKDVSRLAEITEIRAGLPTVQRVIDIGYGGWRVPDCLLWDTALAGAAGAPLEFRAVPFDHPLFVLFSSGTTGPPKAIVHGHGGILLEHLKNHALSWDMGPDDRMLWFTTTAWMMWNALVSSLLVGASVVMLDGNPAHPDLRWQWDLAAETGATVMGASPGFVMACRRAGVTLDAERLAVRVVGSAGSPLPPEGYAWIYDQLGDDVLLNVGSGGTDVCSGIVQNNPLLPVLAGEISGRCLGVDAHAFDPDGRPLVDELGELVITAPMPSMPLGFWGDEDGSRYREAYFDVYPGVWRHGDWVVFHPDGSCRVAGRSDATLNRGGVRLGTAEFYRVVEEVDGIADSLVVHLEDPSAGTDDLVLFVVTEGGVTLDDDLRAVVSTALRSALSPRHAPDEVVEVAAVPRNLTGKKLELPVKRILQGADPAAVVSRDALLDPLSIDPFVRMAASRAAAPTAERSR